MSHGLPPTRGVVVAALVVGCDHLRDRARGRRRVAACRPVQPDPVEGDVDRRVAPGTTPPRKHLERGRSDRSTARGTRGGCRWCRSGRTRTGASPLSGRTGYSPSRPTTSSSGCPSAARRLRCIENEMRWYTSALTGMQQSVAAPRQLDTPGAHELDRRVVHRVDRQRAVAAAADAQAVLGADQGLRRHVLVVAEVPRVRERVGGVVAARRQRGRWRQEATATSGLGCAEACGTYSHEPASTVAATRWRARTRR